MTDRRGVSDGVMLEETNYGRLSEIIKVHKQVREKLHKCLRR